MQRNIHIFTSAFLHLVNFQEIDNAYDFKILEELQSVLGDFYCLTQLDFSVFGFRKYCLNAIVYAHTQLCGGQRVESLILINPNLDLKLDFIKLAGIADFGCKIYTFLSIADFKSFRKEFKENFNRYHAFAKAGMLILKKS